MAERPKATQNQLHNERGVVLVTGLMFLAVLMMVGITTVVISANDVKISRNYNNAIQAFNNAESGVQYAMGKIEDGLSDASYSLPQNVGDTAVITDPGTDTVPGTYSFSLSTIEKLSATAYAKERFQFTSTGNGPSNPLGSTSQADVVATLRREPAIVYAAFGDTSADLNASANVYSYDSGTTPSPTPTDSTGDGDVGSNGNVDVKNGTYIDGYIGLGDDGSNEATLTDTGGTYSGSEDVDRVDPDPLGVVGGEYAAHFTTYSSGNNNASAGISANIINLTPGDTMTLTGPANYYVTSIDIASGATLDIDTSGGEVNIWLTGAGGVDVKNGANINMSVGSLPTDFSIFSDSASSIKFYNSQDFIGLIYAPLATVELKNSTNFYGAIWANVVDMKSSVNLYYDTSLQDDFFSKDMSLVAWDEPR